VMRCREREAGCQAWKGHAGRTAAADQRQTGWSLWGEVCVLA